MINAARRVVSRIKDFVVKFKKQVDPDTSDDNDSGDGSGGGSSGGPPI